MLHFNLVPYRTFPIFQPLLLAKDRATDVTQSSATDYKQKSLQCEGMMLEELCSFVRSTVSAPRMHLLILAPWKKKQDQTGIDI